MVVCTTEMSLELRECGSSQNWGTIPSSGLLPSEGIATQFLGMMTAFTDTSDPELLYSHCWQVKTRIFNLVKNHVLAFLGGL